MKLSTVLCAVNDNPCYYMFIPKQIAFWRKFNIKFIAVYVGSHLPDILQQYKNNIILWSRNLDINTAYVGQNIRLYYPALLDLPDDEMVMITDMDMLPMNGSYYKDGMEKYTIEDFIYYRYVVDGDQIFMCYNAAHPKTWGKIFDIKIEEDIERILYENYDKTYNGIPGSNGWFTDQLIFYKKVINYPNLRILNRPTKRLEVFMHKLHLMHGHKDFLKNYDDAHYHRNFFTNQELIADAEKQLGI